MIIAIPTSIQGSKQSLNQKYVEYAVAAGFDPVIVPYGVEVNVVASFADMLLLPGGIDIDPTYYGFENYRSESVDPDKDAFERSLYNAFVDAEKPIFGICRGFQLIAMEHLFWRHHQDATRLMSFLQHVAGHNGTEALSTRRDIRTQLIFNNGGGINRTEHIQMAVYGGIDTPWSGVVNDHTMFVNSMHHQGLAVCRDAAIVDFTVCGMRMLAFSSRGMKPQDDGGKNILVEAYEIPALKVKAVQWHPEELGEFKMLKRHYEKYASPEQNGNKQIRLRANK